MLTLDTSGVLALLNLRDSHHEDALRSAQSDRGPLVVPVGIIAEIGYLVLRRLGSRVLDSFLADLEDGAFTPDCGEGDLPRIRTLVSRYRSLPLGYADAAVIACAERLGGRVLTYDLRHFGTVAGEGTIQLVGIEEA